MLGHAFDPQAETNIYEHCRPHWSQAGTVVFITFRTADSIPANVVRLWDRQKRAWLAQRGQTSGEVPELLSRLSSAEQKAFRKQFERCREDYLDTCQGRCLLKDPELTGIVGRSLLHFDRQRYLMGDFVVMPNHVHLLAVFPTADALKKAMRLMVAFHGVPDQSVHGWQGKVLAAGTVRSPRP